MKLPKKLRLKILRRHIVKGMCSDDPITGCVVAQALKERFPRRRIQVGFSFAEVGATTYYTTQRGMRFIERATNCEKVNPTTLTLKVDEKRG